MKANNAQAMREALVSIADICDGADTGGLDERMAIYNIAQAALYFAPPRNCDVGTAKEQEARFKEFCGSHFNLNDSDVECRSCPLRKIGSECEFAWAQMPYEEGGAR